MTRNPNINRIGCATALGLISLGGLLGFLIRAQFDEVIKGSPSERGRLVREAGHNFTNPLLLCDVAGEKTRFGELDEFRSEMERLIEKVENKPDLERVALYFRDLNSGSWFGIHESDEFVPGSLMKVPLLIAYLKAAESDQGLLEKKLTYDGSFNEEARKYFKPSDLLKPGRTYATHELIERMIVQSDNNALRLLADDIDKAAFLRTYVQLGLIVPGRKAVGLGDPVTVKDYANLFRILFNASYLNRENSERALRLLSQSEFEKGLMAGVPPGTLVAHKFGERTLDPEGTQNQLHDCGIVYYPGKPYLLCIMTQGTDFNPLERTIRDIASFSYRYVAEKMP